MTPSSIGAYDAKTHLPRLLDEVERGESITITEHGRPVARLVPVSSRTASPETVIAALRTARSGVRRGRGSVRG
jgi:prevent-host-death family protein